jgi:hypothetical protein
VWPFFNAATSVCRYFVERVCTDASQRTTGSCSNKPIINGKHLKSKMHLKLGMVGHACSHSTRKSETEGWQVQGQPGLHSEFQASLSNVAMPCLKKTKAFSAYNVPSNIV